MSSSSKLFAEDFESGVMNLDCGGEPKAERNKAAGDVHGDGVG